LFASNNTAQKSRSSNEVNMLPLRLFSPSHKWNSTECHGSWSHAQLLLLQKISFNNIDTNMQLNNHLSQPMNPTISWLMRHVLQNLNKLNGDSIFQSS